jgi:inosine-uridine nucleoside N-ribohydrolase
MISMRHLSQFVLLLFTLVATAGAAQLLSPPREVLDVSLEPPFIITAPGAEFRDEARPGAMIVGMDRTPKGRIWGCWTGNGDKPDSYFILATSDDGGSTWSKPRLVVGVADPSGKPQRRALVGNVWTDPLGRVWLFFDQSLVAFFDGRAGDWYIRCDNPDAAEPVWSKPVRIADGCTLCKPTVLKNGDWLLPVALWTRDKINPLKFRDAHRDLDPMRMAHVFVSTDQGKIWTRRGGVAFPESDFDEHMIVELRDGRLWMLARTKYGMAESYSTDKGRTWSEPKPSAIKNVSARFFIRRLASGKLLLVKNGPTDQRLPKRSHMSAFLSDDDGKTWRGGLLLDERASVSYPDGFQAPDGLIYILYDWNRHTDAEILMAKFREEDVLAGKFVSPGAKPLILANKATGPKPKPARPRVILDTDMSGDCDDAGALALLHALADRDECDILAVVTNRKDKTNASAAAVDVINTYYGRPNIPIGTDKVGPTDLQRTSPYTCALRDEFPHDAKPDDQMPDALDVYRRVLAAQPDDSVTICSVGAFSNLAELWRREPQLVVTKVRRLVVMGGEFPKSKRPETNIRTHRESARVVASEWPGEIVWHGFEIGNVLITGAGLKQTPKNNPVRRAYELKPYGKRPAIEGGQPSWDQGAALFAVRGAEPELWRAVRGGRVIVDEEGVTTWEQGPITRHYYMKFSGDPAKLAAVIESLMIQPPKRK